MFGPLSAPKRSRVSAVDLAGCRRCERHRRDAFGGLNHKPRGDREPTSPECVFGTFVELWESRRSGSLGVEHL